jgi:ABC-type branched-subunit amino acid transport system substrate-binding protein
MAVAALLAAFQSAGIAASRHVEFDPEDPDPATLIERAGIGTADPVVVVATPRPSARLVAHLRERGHDGPLFGWTAMGRRAFIDAAGAAGDNVVFPLPCDPDFAVGDFGREFSRRYGRTADCTTAQTYDATRLVIEAIDRAGLNRALARDALAAMPSWSGAAGKIEWGPLGQNLREPTLATVANGRVVPLSRIPD